jgi:hypothetical protein
MRQTEANWEKIKSLSCLVGVIMFLNIIFNIVFKLEKRFFLFIYSPLSSAVN